MMKNINLERLAHSIGNDIENQQVKAFWRTIQAYKFAYIATIEAQIDRNLSTKEIIDIHRTFIETIAKIILREYPEFIELAKKEDGVIIERMKSAGDA